MWFPDGARSQKKKKETFEILHFFYWHKFYVNYAVAFSKHSFLLDEQKHVQFLFHLLVNLTVLSNLIFLHDCFCCLRMFMCVCVCVCVCVSYLNSYRHISYRMGGM
jgi:hypothetical protein